MNRYTGRRYDTETGLYYYRARYYSPKLGRFLQVDPIGYEDNMNLYGYTANDPVNNTDPSGMIKITLGASAEGFLVIGASFNASISFDTDTLGLGVSGSAALGAGLGGGVGVEVSASNGSVAAVNGVNAKTEILATGNLVGFQAENTLVSIDEGQTAKPLTTEFTVPLGEVRSENGRVTASRAQLDLKASANVRVEGKVEATTSIIADTVNLLSEGVEELCSCRFADR